MLLEAHDIPEQFNLAAAAASWITLAGFFILPGTFTSLSKSRILEESQGGRAVHHAVQNIPLLPLAGLCYLVGVASLIYLWHKFKRNHIWNMLHIFL